MNDKLTTEQVEDMERQLAEHRRQQEEQTKEQNRGHLQPLIDLGFGTENISGSPQEIVDALRNAAPALQMLDQTMFNLLTSTAQVFQTTNDRIKALWHHNKPEEPSSEAE